MKFAKIIIACLCSITLMINIAYANFDDVSDDKIADAIDVLQTFNILKGYPDNTFRPNSSITRAEFSKVVTCMIGIDSNEAETALTFTDISQDHWARNYIALAFETNIIKGFPDGTFRPEDSITYEQAVKMIVEALDYGEQAIEAGGYPNGYIDIAKRENIIQDIAFNQQDDANRGNIALLVRNALDVPLLEENWQVDETGIRKNTDQTLYKIYAEIFGLGD